jgi:hypothetical protein
LAFAVPVAVALHLGGVNSCDFALLDCSGTCWLRTLQLRFFGHLGFGAAKPMATVLQNEVVEIAGGLLGIQRRIQRRMAVNNEAELGVYQVNLSRAQVGHLCST